MILDAWSRKVVGYAIGRTIDVRLTRAALLSAIERRRPPLGCVHHSDRGAQYAAGLYRQTLAQHGLVGSMGRRGNPYDNAKAESFMKTLKVEEVYVANYRTYADVVHRVREDRISEQARGVTPRSWTGVRAGSGQAVGRC